MAPAVEAGSLATVIQLADNPPEHFQYSPATGVQQPLVLYISRVPGSKGLSLLLLRLVSSKLIIPVDVFLTTMKPKQKSVTAQDVQSSLYYVHVDSVEDYGLLDSGESGDDQPVEHDPRTDASLGSKSSVRRKMLHQTSNSALVDRPEPPPRPLPQPQMHTHVSNGMTQIARKPIRRDGPEPRNLKEAPPLPERSFLGPRPMKQRFLSVDGAALRNVLDRVNVDMRRWSEQPPLASPQLPPRPDSLRRSKFNDATQSAAVITSARRSAHTEDEPLAQHCWNWEKKWEERRLSDDMVRRASSQYNLSEMEDVFQNASLTLIRRYNGEQWNAGRIMTGSKEFVPDDSARSSIGMSIEILTAGYSRFCDPKVSQRSQKRIITEGSREIPSITEQGSNTSSNEGKEKAVFRRHLHLHGNARRRNEGLIPVPNESSSTKGARSSFDFRRHSQQSPNGVDPSLNGSAEHKRGSPKLHHFESPWNGVCEFRTGIAGRSLKCKHSYPSNNTNFGPGIHSATVSEIRFNLPSSAALGTPALKSTMPGTPREAKRSLMFSRLQDRGSSSLAINEAVDSRYFGSKVELEDRLDLSLGQEHAGGGFGGKQAKLGKLIIENEGLQMLDLIVAANMALWWKVYERFT